MRGSIFIEDDTGKVCLNYQINFLTYDLVVDPVRK